MEAYKFLSRPGQLKNAERASQRVLSLPLYPGLSPAAVDRVVTQLRELDHGMGAGER